MIRVFVDVGHEKYSADLSRPLDISIAMSPTGPRAWYAEPMMIEPVVNDHFTGSVALGGAVNFRNVFFNPHAHGTHTEGVGHISNEDVSVQEALAQHFFIARVISVHPKHPATPRSEAYKNDLVISYDDLKPLLTGIHTVALVIRTLPNSTDKKIKNYSNTNFCYIEPEAMKLIVESGVEHLVVDLPSVDREQDEGLLESHHIFWQYPQHTRRSATITEFAFIPDEVVDGLYLLNLQTVNLMNDAAPSRPVLFALSKTNPTD